VENDGDTSAAMQKYRDSLQQTRRRIEHEDNLLNQRVSWIVSSQAFLLTGYAILLNAPTEFRNEHHARDHALLMRLIPITSIWITLLLWIAMLAGIAAMRALRATAEKHPTYEADHIQGSPATRILGLVPIALIPGVFLVTWLLLVMR
jgi:hypothetical protein